MKSADPNQSPGDRDTRTGTGEDAADRIRQTGREAMDDANQEVRSRLERGKSTAAQSAASTSEVLDHAAEEFSAQGQETLARATSVLAEKLSDLSRQLEQRSLDDLSRDAMRLARSNPGLFVAGGVAIGLALSRFLKASSHGTEHYSTGGSEQWTGGSEWSGSSEQWSGGAAYGGEGALPSQGSQSTSTRRGEGAYSEPGTTTDREGSRGPGRSPSTSGTGGTTTTGGTTNTGNTMGGQHE